MSEKTPVIQFDSVSKSFNDLTVLDDISLEVNAGSAMCILGPSGTGKSVTLKLMIGLIKPDSGQISVSGQEITNMDSRELSPLRKKMGFLFQNSALFDSQTLGENVAFPLRRHTDMDEAAIRQAVEERLREVGLEDASNKMPADLSGGMRKRAALARAMALEPSILLVDEPSAGLDPVTSEEIDQLLVSVKQNKKTTLVVVTHNIPSARRIGDELLMLNRGEIVSRGTPEEFERSEDDLVRRFMSAQQGG